MAGMTSVPRTQPQLAALSPLGQLRAGRRPRRLVQLLVGLTAYGVWMALMVRSGLGLDPWDVFHAGIARHVPLSFGQVVIATGVVVLLRWVPLRQLPGLGTVLNAVVIGLVTDAALGVLSMPGSLAARLGLLVGGILLNALATALYIGSQFGPGPRDGLMTGLVRRTGWSVGRVRTAIEVSVLVVGWVMGGAVGLGTVLYAVGIGPLVHVLLPRFVVPLPEPAAQRLVASSTDASGATMTSTVVNRSSVSHCSRSTSTLPS
jgi:uncharacterized membrane protein YczE